MICDEGLGYVYWNSSVEVGDDNKDFDWVLYLNVEDGSISVRDIMNRNIILWINNDEVISYDFNGFFVLIKVSVWIIVGVVIGVFVFVIGVVGLYYCRRVSKYVFLFLSFFLLLI